MQQYSELSRPIDAMQFLQKQNITNAHGVVQRNAINGVLNRIKTQQNLPGARQTDSITPEQIQALTTLRDDMNLGERSNLGKPLGSDTFQNLYTVGKTSALLSGAGGRAASVAVTGLGLTDSGGGIAVAAGAAAQMARAAYAGRVAATQQAARDALVQKLLNPYGS
jgi:hypothetical protein